MVHGDDFVAVGDEKATKKLQASLEKAYKVKCEVLGDGAEEKKEIRVLNRIIRRVDTGFALEADPRYAEIIVRDLGLIGAKPQQAAGQQGGPQEGRWRTSGSGSVSEGCRGVRAIYATAAATDIDADTYVSAVVRTADA